MTREQLIDRAGSSPRIRTRCRRSTILDEQLPDAPRSDAPYHASGRGP